MCRKLVFLASLALVLSMLLTSAVRAADPSLVGWWRLDDGGGTTAVDSSGNGNDGALMGDPQWALGRISGALLFDGTDDYVEVPHAEILTVDSEVTVMAWINASQHEVPGAGYQGIIAKGNGPRSYSLYTTAAGVMHFSTGPGGGYTGSTSSAQVPLNEWVHVCAQVINGGHQYYLNGEDAGSGGAGATLLGSQDTGTVLIGRTQEGANRSFGGLIDDARVYNRALSQEEINTAMFGQGQPLAFGPDPEDGALLEDTWATLSWTPGDFTVSHDVYMGENFDDVNDSTHDSPVFRGNQASTMFIVGFAGFSYPDGLVPGTTYYWRIDEVNDANAASPWKGETWSFWVPPKKAYNASPPDGATFIDPNVVLSWTGGFGAKLHTVYFGDDLDTVTNAAGGIPQATTTFTPGTLEFEKTYYWRVDEFDALATHTGDVMGFTTTLPGLGELVLDRWENFTGDLPTLKANPKYPNSPDATEVLTGFSWDGPDIDNYGARIHGWVYVPATGDYTFWLNTDDNGELWLSTDDDPGSAKLIALESSWSGLNAWGSGEEQSDPIPLIGGEKYYIMALWQEGGGGDHCQVAWQGPGVPERTVIAGTNLSPFEPMSAYGARPANHATGVTQVPVLSWKAGLEAASHEVYFGTDEDAVANATKSSPEYKGSRALGAESFDPGKLPWESTYYWRVDQINTGHPDSPWVGNVWTFTTANFLIVDDFESYDDIDPVPGGAETNRIFDKWIDGFGTTTNGALVGNDLPPYAETTIVNNGAQSLVYSYDNNLKTSEATLTLVYPRDWTEEGVAKLILWYRGDPANAAERMFVALNGNAVAYHNDPAVTQTAEWTEWVIDLQEFASQGVALTNVSTIAIGFGTKNAPAAGGAGTMYFDDIRLYK